MGRTVFRRSQRLRGVVRSYAPAKYVHVTQVLKQYEHPNDPAKNRINNQYAKWTMHFLGSEACHVILDSRHLVTSKQLTDEGFSCDNIYAPNINKEDCAALRKYGVNAPHRSIERFIARTAARPNALWYDSQTTMGGSKLHGYYVGVVVDEFLKKNIKRTVVVAVSIATRARANDSIHKDSEYTLIEQLTRLFAIRGFTAIAHWSSKYKPGMMYAVWTVEYTGAVAAKPLLTWKNHVHKYIGFPTGYVL